MGHPGLLRAPDALRAPRQPGWEGAPGNGYAYPRGWVPPRPPETITALLIQNKTFKIRYWVGGRKEGLVYMINMQINKYII